MNRCTRGALASLTMIGLAIATTACGDDANTPDVTVDLTTGSNTTMAGNDSVTTMSPGSDSGTSGSGPSSSGVSSGANSGASSNGGGTGITASTTK